MGPAMRPRPAARFTPTLFLPPLSFAGGVKIVSLWEPCPGHQEPTFGADDAHTPLQQTGVVTRMAVQIHVAEEATKPMLVSACGSVMKHLEDGAGTDQYLATK